MHRVGVAERMRGDRHRECHPVDGGRFNRFANPGPYCPVGDVPDAGFLCSAGTLVASFQRYFQGGHHHLQLADVVVIGERNQAMRLTTGG